MRDSLEPVTSLLLADRELMRSLGSLSSYDGLILALSAAVAARGLPLDGHRLRAALATSHALPLTAAPPPGWLPVAVHQADGALLLEWLWFGEDGLSQPFFEQSAHRAAALPINALMRCLTPFAALEAWREAPPPAGLIMHMSRCGSTLAARMLAASPNCTVVPEAPALDTVIALAAEGKVPEQAIAWMAAALLRQREATGGAGVLKLDAWHTLALPLLLRVFPETPIAFLYRDPIEVLVSQRRRPGLHVVPGVLPLELYGLPGAAAVEPEAYPAFVLDGICRAALAASGDPRLLLVDYSELPDACVHRVAPHFGIAPDDRMRAIATTDAKAPDRAFVHDSAAKRDEATADLRAQCDRGLDASFAALEEARTARG